MGALFVDRRVSMGVNTAVILCFQKYFFNQYRTVSVST